jgi:hypothetical protein
MLAEYPACNSDKILHLDLLWRLAMYRHLPLVALLLLVSGCFAPVPALQTTDYQAQLDADMAQRVAQARAACASSPGDPQRAYVFARELENAYVSGAVARGAVDGAALLGEAGSYLEQAASAAPDQEGMLYTQKGTLLVVAGDREGGYGVIEQAMQKTPNLYGLAPLLAWYDENHRGEDMLALCQRLRPLAHDDELRYALLDRCFHHTHAESVDVGLAWATDDDRDFYERQRELHAAEDAADVEAERQRSEAERQALHDSFAQPGATQAPAGSGAAQSGSASAGPATVSVYLRSRCSQTVRVCFGEDPKFRCDLTTSISGNSVSSYTFQPGDMIWVVDEQNNGLASASISAGTREVEITSSCTGLSAR